MKNNLLPLIAAVFGLGAVAAWGQPVPAGHLSEGYINEELLRGGARQQAAPKPPPKWVYEDRFHGHDNRFNILFIAPANQTLRSNDGREVPFTWKNFENYNTLDTPLSQLSPWWRYRPFGMDMTGENHDHMAASVAEAEQVMQYKCAQEGVAPQNCLMLAAYMNTCNAVVAAWLKDYSGVRLYTARNAYSPTRNDRRAEFDNFQNLMQHYAQAPLADAMRRCQSDPAVHAASCEALEDQATFCALPAQVHSYHGYWEPQ